MHEEQLGELLNTTVNVSAADENPTTDDLVASENLDNSDTSDDNTPADETTTTEE